LVQVLAAEPVLGTVLHEALGGVDHEDASTGLGVLLVEHNDAGWDAGAVEEVGWQSDDAFDIAALDEGLADRRFGVASEEDTVRQDDRGFPSALEGLENVQQEGVVAVLLGRSPELEAVVVVLQAVAPRL